MKVLYSFFTALALVGLHCNVFANHHGSDVQQSESTRAYLEYCVPSGTIHSDKKAYLSLITTTGAAVDINYTADAFPADGEVYQHLTPKVTASAGSTFTLNLKGNIAGPKDAVHQDLRYNSAKIFADWDGDGTFDEIGFYGSEGSPTDPVAANYDEVLNIAHTINVPAKNTAAEARIRVIYNNAWKGRNAINACMTNIAEGIAYDIDVKINSAIDPENPAPNNSGIEFNGVDQYMYIPNHADFQIAAEESFSVTCWIKVPAYKNAMRFVSKRSMSAGGVTGYELWTGNSVSKFWALNSPYAGSGNVLSAYSTRQGSLNKWIHVGFTVDRSAGKIYMYQDGILTNISKNPLTKQSSSSDPWTVDNDFNVFVGAGIANAETANNFFKGKMANLRFWNKALSAEEMKSDMISSVTSETADLLAAYNFQNLEGLVVNDIKGVHNGTLVNFPVEASIIADVQINKESDFTGRGNKNEILSHLKISVGGTNPLPLKNIKFTLSKNTALSNITSLKIYSTKATSFFNASNFASAVLLGEANPATGEITIETTDKSLDAGWNNLWITCDVAADAKEGDKVGVSLVSITYNESDVYTPTAKQTEADREILLARTRVFSPGDFGSANYRIPAIITADDNSLVVITDKRKYNQTDLPEDIDVVARKSTDGGLTWSTPVTIAQGTGKNQGFGDAGVVKTNDGKLVAILAGGPGLWTSTAANPIRTYISESSDNGATWSTPRDITDQLYGAGCSDEVRKNWLASFCASGNGLRTKSGRIMFVAAVRESFSYTLNNYIYYSDDNGKTWSVSGKAMTGGDESKVVELNNGDLLMSIRNPNKGQRIYTRSTDEGATWSTYATWSDLRDPGCNGDMIRYTSTKNGFEKDRLLHSIPDNSSSRKNVSVFVSYDEGNSWATGKSICPGESAYSSLTVLPDGTIGAYFETGSDAMSLYYANFSLKWLTDGADQYHPAGTIETVVMPKVSVAEGTYEKAQTVTLTTSTKGASIYYTLDGSTPSATSTKYENAIEIATTTILKAIAVKEGLANSEILSVTYTIKNDWNIPTGTVHSNEDRYITSASTENAKENLSFSQSEKPTTVYIKAEQGFSVNQAATFTLKMQTTESTKWCHAIIFADWNRNYSFDDDGELIAKVGKDAWEDNQLYLSGNPEVLDITQVINVPANAKLGTTRLRVQFTDAWHNKTPEHTHSGDDVIDKGGVYDFDMTILDPSSISADTQDRLLMYPTFTKDMVYFNDVNAVNIYSTSGILVASKTGNVQSMNISELSQGIYYVKMVSQGNVITQKLVKR